MGRGRQRAPEWIVCMREERDVLRGRVSCPALGLVAFNLCMTCRRLESRSDDRALGPSCLLEDGPSPTSSAFMAEPR